ncbi:RNA-binding S4 domain-containing protein [Aurantimonas sp. VKM B-3413]|uniref:RNA-binding S4 domain-containing protein n=1 Tax=Aurantimonas sp. VKM B-3413 TaxID=2779401 RepID=UPI001E49D011|nr:RNA-binding S4 domain-containing protein [Aurantimonas sp. VKM B-3413]MCB8840723.1 RNA-binding S4 domain-containing protein [Aurantimonas sp. VKM B-3413]
MADNPTGEAAAGAGQRVDKWLFFARVAKSRTLAQKLVQSGVVRVNREKINNAARIVRPGDVLTLSIGGRVRVLKVLDPGTRRGPASEAALLYEEMGTAAASPAAATDASVSREDARPADLSLGQPAPSPGGRPGKHDRCALQRLRRGEAG